MEKRHSFSPKLFWRIVISILLISLITILFVLVGKDKSYAKNDGTITVLINDKDNNIVSKERLSYKKGDELYNLIDDNYSLLCDVTAYGHFLKGIKGKGFSIETDGRTSWIWLEILYLNDGAKYSDEINFDNYSQQYVSTGIDGIKLVDNMIFAINERDNAHSSSVINQDVIIEKKDNSGLYIGAIIVLIILLLAYFIWILIDFIWNHQGRKITIRDLTIIVSLATILLVQEELLTFIPNVQLTFMLIMLYGAVLGFKRGSIIVLIHVLLDNLIMSSFGIFTILPMIIGYEITLLFGYLFGKKNEYILAIFAGISALIYSALFIPINIFVYDVKPIIYILSDIPFVSIMVINNILCMILLYKPLYNILDKEINPEIEEINFDDIIE